MKLKQGANWGKKAMKIKLTKCWEKRKERTDYRKSKCNIEKQQNQKVIFMKISKYWQIFSKIKKERKIQNSKIGNERGNNHNRNHRKTKDHKKLLWTIVQQQSG